MEELTDLFKNLDYQQVFLQNFLKEIYDLNEKSFNVEKLKEKCSLDYYNLTLLKERIVLVPFKHWVEMHSSSSSIPQNVFWISEAPLNMNPTFIVENINNVNKNIGLQENELICFLETNNIHGKAIFYFYSKEFSGKKQFNANLILIEESFDLDIDSKGKLNF